MFKNPYLFPLVGLFVLGALFVVQNELGKADGAISKGMVALPPPTKMEQLLTFRDQAHGALDSFWSFTKSPVAGFKSHSLYWPVKGTIEWDYFGSRDSARRDSPFLVLERVVKGQRKWGRWSVTDAGDSLRVTLDDQDYHFPLTGKLREYPLRLALDWDSLQTTLYLNGRTVKVWPLRRASALETVTFYLAEMGADSVVTARHDIRDFQFLQRP